MDATTEMKLFNSSEKKLVHLSCYMYIDLGGSVSDKAPRMAQTSPVMFETVHSAITIQCN